MLFSVTQTSELEKVERVYLFTIERSHAKDGFV